MVERVDAQCNNQSHMKTFRSPQQFFCLLCSRAAWTISSLRLPNDATHANKATCGIAAKHAYPIPFTAQDLGTQALLNSWTFTSHVKNHVGYLYRPMILVVIKIDGGGALWKKIIVVLWSGYQSFTFKFRASERTAELQRVLCAYVLTLLCWE